MYLSILHELNTHRTYITVKLKKIFIFISLLLNIYPGDVTKSGNKKFNFDDRPIFNNNIIVKKNSFRLSLKFIHVTVFFYT